MRSVDACDARKRRIGSLAIKLCKATSLLPFSGYKLTSGESHDLSANACHALRNPWSAYRRTGSSRLKGAFASSIELTSEELSGSILCRIRFVLPGHLAKLGDL